MISFTIHDLVFRANQFVSVHLFLLFNKEENIILVIHFEHLGFFSPFLSSSVYLPES